MVRVRDAPPYDLRAKTKYIILWDVDKRITQILQNEVKLVEKKEKRGKVEKMDQ